MGKPPAVLTVGACALHRKFQATISSNKQILNHKLILIVVLILLGYCVFFTTFRQPFGKYMVKELLIKMFAQRIYWSLVNNYKKSQN